MFSRVINYKSQGKHCLFIFKNSKKAGLALSYNSVTTFKILTDKHDQARCLLFSLIITVTISICLINNTATYQITQVK